METILWCGVLVFVGVITIIIFNLLKLNNLFQSEFKPQNQKAREYLRKQK